MSAKALGRQPKPITGDSHEIYGDPVREAKVLAADQAFEKIWVDDYPPQQAVKARIRSYMQKWESVRGTPIGGLRLCQPWHSGKSSIVENLKLELAKQREIEGRPPNPFEIVHITIEHKMALKTFYQEFLRQSGDEFFGEEARRGPDQDRRTMKMLENKIARYVRKLGIRLLVADEIQRLGGAGISSKAVIERLQTFLDRGIVPLLLIGNEKSESFFSDNSDLSVRCGRPLKLEPMKTKSCAIEAGHFQNFCRSFDDQLVSTGIFAIRSGLSQKQMLDPIISVTGGHIGRVARLIEEAYPVAIRRGAASIEMLDFSIVTREYAIVNGWIKTDPFCQAN